MEHPKKYDHSRVCSCTRATTSRTVCQALHLYAITYSRPRNIRPTFKWPQPSLDIWSMTPQEVSCVVISRHVDSAFRRKPAQTYFSHQIYIRYLCRIPRKRLKLDLFLECTPRRMLHLAVSTHLGKRENPAELKHSVLRTCEILPHSRIILHWNQFQRWTYLLARRLLTNLFKASFWKTAKMFLDSCDL